MIGNQSHNMLEALPMNDVSHELVTLCFVVGLSLLVVIVVALFICVLTLGTGLAYMHRFALVESMTTHMHNA